MVRQSSLVPRTTLSAMGISPLRARRFGHLRGVFVRWKPLLLETTAKKIPYMSYRNRPGDYPTFAWSYRARGCFAFSRSALRLVSRSADCNIRVWDLADEGQMCALLKVHQAK